MKAKKLPSGSWNVQVFVGMDQNGKKIRKSFTAPTKKEAEYLAASFKAHHQEITRDSTAMTLSEAIDKYIGFKGGTLSPSTIRGYRNVQKNNFRSIMSIKLNKLTVSKIQAAINSEIGSKKPKTLQNQVGFIKSVFKMFAPSLSLSAITLPQKEKYEAQELTMKEVISLLKAIRDDSCAVPLFLAMCGGLRASELIGLTWADYSTAKKTISVRKAVVPDENNKLVKKGTKTTESKRTFEIPAFLADLLDKHINIDPITPIITVSLPCIRSHLDKICTKNGIPHIRLHDLRHINASIMGFLGIPLKYALERGGWDDISTMDKIYQYSFSDEKKMVDDKINRFFTDAINS